MTKRQTPNRPARDDDPQRNEKFAEAFDRLRATRPARSGAAGTHTKPPSEGTDPGQPYSAPPGASGKNK
jgi:hypothetical protein